MTEIAVNERVPEFIIDYQVNLVRFVVTSQFISIVTFYFRDHGVKDMLRIIDHFLTRFRSASKAISLYEYATEEIPHLRAFLSTESIISISELLRLPDIASIAYRILDIIKDWNIWFMQISLFFPATKFLLFAFFLCGAYTKLNNKWRFCAFNFQQ